MRIRNMQLIAAAIIGCAVGLSSRSAPAQQAPSGPVRTILAIGRVTSVIDAPMSFRLLRVTLPAGSASSYRGALGSIYGLSGDLSVVLGNDKLILHEGEGAFIAAGTNVTVQAAGADPAIFMHYLLIKTADLDQPVWSAPAGIADLHRMALPAAILKPGPYEYSMIHVTAPLGAPRTPPHMRSTAALYYVLADGLITIWPSGPDGTITGEPRTERRPTGAIQEEPFGFVHSWGSPATSAIRLLQANISQEGVREIIFVK